MARTYSSTPVLSKVKIGDSYYYLKDADARGILDSINADVYAALQLSLGTVGGNDGKLVTAQNIKSYVDSAVAALPEFDVIVLGPSEPLPAASAETFHKIYLKPASGEAAQNIYVEYITVRAGAGTELDPYTYSWEKLGDTAMDLSGYVTNIQYVAASHKLQQQKGNGEYADVHQFGNMADADTASTTVADYVTGLTFSGGAKAADTFSANVPTAIDVSKFNGGSKAADTFNANVPTTIDVTKFNGGSKAADTFSAASLGTGFVSAGSAASFTEGAFTPASLTTISKTFAIEGVKAAVGTGADAECLIFTAASTVSGVKVVDTFNGGSKAADTFSANVPTAIDVTKFNGGSFTEGAFTAASLGAGFYSAGSAATFSEGAFSAASLGAGFYTPGSAASFSEGAFTAATASLQTGNKKITVSPDAGE